MREREMVASIEAEKELLTTPACHRHNRLAREELAREWQVLISYTHLLLEALLCCVKKKQMSQLVRLFLSISVALFLGLPCFIKRGCREQKMGPVWEVKLLLVVSNPKECL